LFLFTYASIGMFRFDWATDTDGHREQILKITQSLWPMQRFLEDFRPINDSCGHHPSRIRVSFRSSPSVLSSPRGSRSRTLVHAFSFRPSVLLSLPPVTWKTQALYFSFSWKTYSLCYDVTRYSLNCRLRSISTFTIKMTSWLCSKPAIGSRLPEVDQVRNAPI